ncbi:MAG: 50S ribosomal protein L11 methyltransferase [Tissierella sp.]|uniref:50S ribosomal protein L11 methyltransferase n=1 Tax=Tissierella sp. TaxID=41274 RepID=UPI003F9E6F71
MKWIEVDTVISKDDEEIVSSIFYDAGASGLDIEDANDLIDLSNRKKDWDFLDIDIESLNLDDIKIKAYFSQADDVNSILSFLKENIEEKELGKITTKEIEDEDYINNWKKYFKTFKIGENIVIKPSWEEYEGKNEDIIIDIDPGMAFGTGTHETTSLCIEALEKYLKNEDIVFDIGCGSGILSIASAKLGAKKVTSIDLDPLCVKVSKENILKNNLKDKIEVKKGNLLDVLYGEADLIVANIIAEAIITMTDSIRNYLKDGGIFISSGIILEKKDEVLQALKDNSFEIKEIKSQGEWVAIISIKR